MKKDKKTEVLNSIGFVAVALVLCLFMAFYGQTNTTTALYPICFERQESLDLLSQDKEWVAETTAELRAENTAAGKAALEGLEHRQFAFSAKTAESMFISGGEDFTADFYDAGADTTVILLHGFERNVEFSLRYAEFWVEQGVNILIPQLRGHDGLKGINTLGYYEQYDLYDLLVAAQAETGVSEYIVHGEGSGAVAALLLSGSERYMITDSASLSALDISLKLIVAESAYTDMETVLKHQASRQFALSGFMTGTAINMTVKRNLGFSPKDVNVTAAVAQSGTPTLFVSGADDGFTPNSWTITLHDSCSADKSLLLVPGAGHATAWEKDRAGYESAITQFLGQLTA